jgi:pectate lyase
MESIAVSAEGPAHHLGHRAGILKKRRFLALTVGMTSLALAACSKREADAEAAPAAGASPPVAEKGLLAFPGAEGQGRYAKGGRGGEIMFVNTLADSGPGSLRACIEGEAPRTCIFRVSGVIRFTSERPIIKNPFLTIAGQTAPGDGVLITHDGGEMGLTPIHIRDANDVVIRHIRVRMDKLGDNRAANDAVTVKNSWNVILDHVSGSWARGGLVDLNGDNDAITVSWSIFAEGLKKHDRCALLGNDSRTEQRVSFINNVCAHNGDRSPEVDFPTKSCVEVVNNVIYNAAGGFMEIGEAHGGASVNIVGNHFRAGPDSTPETVAMFLNRKNSAGKSRVYQSGNQIDSGVVPQNKDLVGALVDVPACPLTLQPLPVETAYQEVVSLAGALPRDSVDRRIINEVDGRKGSRVAQPGSLPELRSEEPPLDEDFDGMEDAWESVNNIDASVFNPWEDADGDGWTNLDEFLDFAHQRLVLRAGARGVE